MNFKSFLEFELVFQNVVMMSVMSLDKVLTSCTRTHECKQNSFQIFNEASGVLANLSELNQIYDYY